MKYETKIEKERNKQSTFMSIQQKRDETKRDFKLNGTTTFFYVESRNRFVLAGDDEQNMK